MESIGGTLRAILFSCRSLVSGFCSVTLPPLHSTGAIPLDLPPFLYLCLGLTWNFTPQTLLLLPACLTPLGLHLLVAGILLLGRVVRATVGGARCIGRLPRIHTCIPLPEVISAPFLCLLHFNT